MRSSTRGRPFWWNSPGRTETAFINLLRSIVAGERLLKYLYAHRAIGEIFGALGQSKSDGPNQLGHISFSGWRPCHFVLLYCWCQSVSTTRPKLTERS